MFTIIQSHRTERLVEQLLTAYKSKDQPIFAEFIVIVPSMVLGDWLDKSIASQAGISTLVTTKFWGQYQWTLMQEVLAEYNLWLESEQREQEIITVPEVAVLTGSVMQWRLFGYFTYYQTEIMANDSHPLYPFLSTLLDEESDRSQQDIRLWSLATDFSRVFSRYLNHREDWLTLWSNDTAVGVEALVAEKDKLSMKFDKYATFTPEWLVAHYIELEAAQRHLWRLLFAAVYEHRAAIETRFWDIMSGRISGSGIDIQAILPKQLHIFTIQQLPQNELKFLQQLSTHINITLLHYNPSQLFWADIVDKQWLQRQQVINPENVYLQDYGHTLLSRLGKQSRETFAMLAGLDSNDNKEGFKLDWQDRFDTDNDQQDGLQSTTDETRPLSLLAHLQQDVLMLDESATQRTTAGRLSAALSKQIENDVDIEVDVNIDEMKNNSNTGSNNSLSSSEDDDDTQDGNEWYNDAILENKRNQQSRQWRLSQYDNSLSIHSCHNLQRQLEVLRGMIGRWLNEPSDDGKQRHLSDIVVLLPDVDRHHELINSVFVNGEGQDGLKLPAKVTGVVDKSIRQLWEAIRGFYSLLGSDSARFEAAEVLDWLMLPPLYESLGLTHEQMSRACDLLEQAGFVRGFDEEHLQQTLDIQDYDYRFSFAYALDQIALGLVMPEAGISDCLYPKNWLDNTLPEKTMPISAISLADAPIIEALCRVYAGLNGCRHEYQARHKAEEWLNNIESHIIHPYFGALDQTRPMRAIFNAMNGFKSSLRANRHYQRYHADDETQANDVMNNSASDPLSGSSSAVEANASHVEYKLSQVSTLPLKLNFMLDSIEDELESQQVSAEPTGVITFGRFGALRNVPFGLVVMLNMDLSEFPSRDRDNRYDLMKAGLAKRGDRFSEDDDNGAFLDALLCARNACWIFYNGQRLTDTHEHLPANPVSELLHFLQGEVQWQWEPLKNEQKALKDNSINNKTDNVEGANALAAQVQRYMPKLIEQWLVTRHSALPFATEVFIQPELNAPSSSIKIDSQPTDNNQLDKQDDGQVLINLLARAMQREKSYQQSTNAPAKVWHDVFERLQAQDGNNSSSPIKVNLPTKNDYVNIARYVTAEDNTNEPLNITQVDMQYLYYQVRHPAKHFLREQQVHIVLPEEETAHQEPLSLSGLGAYKVNEQLLNELTDRSHLKQDELDSRSDSRIDSSENHALSAISSLLYNPVMPAGVARQSTLQYQQLKITQQCQEFAEKLSELGIETEASNQLLTLCAETMITAHAPDINMHTHGQLQIRGMIPIGSHSENSTLTTLSESTSSTPQQASPKLWLNILPNSARTQYLLKFWLSHVYWQVARRTTDAQVAANDGKSIWRFNKGSDEYKKTKGKATFLLQPIAYEAALAELLKWIRFAHVAGQNPITILPVHAMTYLDKVNDPKNDAANKTNDISSPSNYQPKRSDFDSWLWSGYSSDVIYDSCSQHELWQYILYKQDVFAKLMDALPALAEPLFGAMNEALTPL